MRVGLQGATKSRRNQVKFGWMVDVVFLRTLGGLVEGQLRTRSTHALGSTGSNIFLPLAEHEECVYNDCACDSWRASNQQQPSWEEVFAAKKMRQSTPLPASHAHVASQREQDWRAVSTTPELSLDNLLFDDGGAPRSLGQALEAAARLGAGWNLRKQMYQHFDAAGCLPAQPAP